MINALAKKFNGLDRDVEALSKVLLILIMLLCVRVVQLIYEKAFDQLWSALASMTALLAALLVARVATRLMTSNDIIRENDRHFDLVRVTHHLIAIIQDLRARVGYAKAMLGEGNYPVFTLGEIAASIERRYEVLLERDYYRFLPGPSVELIVSMSGTIFGICTLAGAMERVSNNKQIVLIESILPTERKQQVSNLDALMNDLGKLLDQIYEMRQAIDVERAL